MWRSLHSKNVKFNTLKKEGNVWKIQQKPFKHIIDIKIDLFYGVKGRFSSHEVDVLMNQAGGKVNKFHVCRSLIATWILADPPFQRENEWYESITVDPVELCCHFRMQIKEWKKKSREAN